MQHLLQGRVDPDFGRDRCGQRHALDEALGMVGVCACEDAGPDFEELIRPTVMDVRRGEQGDAAVAVPAVVPTEKALAEGPGVFE